MKRSREFCQDLSRLEAQLEAVNRELESQQQLRRDYLSVCDKMELTERAPINRVFDTVWAQSWIDQSFRSERSITNLERRRETLVDQITKIRMAGTQGIVNLVSPLFLQNLSAELCSIGNITQSGPRYDLTSYKIRCFRPDIQITIVKMFMDARIVFPLARLSPQVLRQLGLFRSIRLNGCNYSMSFDETNGNEDGWIWLYSSLSPIEEVCAVIRSLLELLA